MSRVSLLCGFRALRQRRRLELRDDIYAGMAMAVDLLAPELESAARRDVRQFAQASSLELAKVAFADDEETLGLWVELLTRR